MTKPWPRLGHRQLCNETRILRVCTERFESPRTGAALDATLVEASDWVNIIALTPGGDTILIRQYRFASDTLTLEVPGGAVDAAETPLEADQRELREETGYVSEQWQPLSPVYPNPAFMENRLHCFVARDCVREGELQLDPGEDIEVVEMSQAEVDSELLRGGIDHALVLAIFLRFKAGRHRSSLRGPAGGRRFVDSGGAC